MAKAEKIVRDSFHEKKINLNELKEFGIRNLESQLIGHIHSKLPPKEKIEFEDWMNEEDRKTHIAKMAGRIGGRNRRARRRLIHEALVHIVRDQKTTAYAIKELSRDLFGICPSDEFIHENFKLVEPATGRRSVPNIEMTELDKKQCLVINDCLGFRGRIKIE